MIFTYNKTDKVIEVCEETEFKLHNILERQDLEKWVKDYPEILGEELLILTTEYDKFDKTNERLDLLALDRFGNLVVIELKRDDSGRSVDLQAIKYAAYCSTLTFNDVINLHDEYLKKNGNTLELTKVKKRLLDFITENSDFEELNDRPRIMLVAKDYRPEVTASVLWLRKFSIDITCIKLTPYEFNNDVLAFESSVLIPLQEAEDFVIKVERKDNEDYNLTLREEEYLQFYNELIIELRARLPLSFSTPLPRASYTIPTGFRGIHFELAFHGRPRSSFAIELHFEGPKEVNQKSIEKLSQLQEALEKSLQETVIFEKNWRKRFARVYIEKQEGRITEELKAWIADKTVTFYNTLYPEIQKLKKR